MTPQSKKERTSYIHTLKDAKTHKDHASKGIKILKRCFTARWPHMLVGTNSLPGYTYGPRCFEK